MISNPFRWAWLRVRGVVRRGALEREMKEELEAHLAHATERLIARGMSPAEARYAARREFGNVALIEETGRDAWGTRAVESLVADVRFAFRYFARKPLTTLTIVLVLALGIGVNTALFSVMQAFTMRPAPGVPKDAAQVRIWGVEQTTRTASPKVRDLSFAELQALAEQKETFRDVAAWVSDEMIVESTDGSMTRGGMGEFVTPNYWTTLGVRTVAGPGFAVAERGVPDLAVVIAFTLAEEMFASPAQAIGQQILVNGIPVRVVGVAPPRFEGAIPDNGRPRLWLPISARAEVAHTSPSWLSESRFSVFGRIAPHVRLAQASVIASQVSTRLMPDSLARTGVIRSAEVLSMRSLPPHSVYAEEIIALSAISLVGLLILLVACTNVSSLLVASAVGRRQEIAVRLSLGASRARVLRQLLTESALLAVAGGTAGLLICWWVTTLIANRANVDIVPDTATILFTMTFAIGTGLVFGLSPALHATRAGVATALRESGTGASSRSRLQRGFVIAQIVFSQPLLLLIAVILATLGSDSVSISDSLGDHLITARFRPLTETGALTQRREAVVVLGQQIAAEPGVQGVVPEPAAFAIKNVVVSSLDSTSMQKRALPAARVHVEGTPPGYFALLGVPLVLGRDVSLADTVGSVYPVVIGSDLARTLWGDVNPIGKTLIPTEQKEVERDSASMVVIGVYDASHATTRGPGDRVFTAHGKRWRPDMLLIRTQSPGKAYVPTLQKFIQVNAPGLPVTELATLTDLKRAERRLELQVLAAASAAGGIALLMASIGLFAVVALSVGQRRREIGIRIAVGGEPRRVAGMFFVSGVRMSVIGLALGLPVSMAAMHLGLTQGIILAPEFNLPMVGLGIALVMLLVATGATWLPARKAANVDPSLALRSE